MRVAIVGGGAAGLVTAYLLDGTHEVHLYERANVLGGNVRTLNRNVASARLPPGVNIENGTLGFHRASYPTVHRLLARLEVPLLEQASATALFLPGGRYCLSDLAEVRRRGGVRALLGEIRKLGGAGRDLARFLVATARPPRVDRLRGVTFDEILDRDRDRYGEPFKTWIRCAVMLTWSTPATHLDRFPAAIGMPAERAFNRDHRWSFVEGGVYRYMEALIARLTSTTIHLGCRLDGVTRDPGGVELRLAAGDRRHYDAVVFATTPGCVLPLLVDPSEAERRRFVTWQDGRLRTIAHTDPAVYRGYATAVRSPGDFFVRDDGGLGYNTYMNRAYGLDPAVPYSFAYNLDDRIDPGHVLDVQEHVTPRYDAASLATRDEIAATSGERRTFHAGAYLGNGLHEGAIASAVEVARRLGGRRL